MSEAFLDIINASIAASYIILAVLLLRFALKKAPKWSALALWAVVAFRLICPIFIESIFSLIPSAATFPEGIMQAETPQIHSGFSTANTLINEQLAAATPEVSANPLQIALGIASYIWVIGAILMAIWATVGYVRLRLSVRDSVKLQNGVYECKRIDTPFLLGVFRPRVYLPCGIDAGAREYILAHEFSHKRHLDNIWKPLGYALLTVHWFNPLMWASYILFCRDIESACDERVISSYSNEQRADYSSALLICSVKRRTVAACPLAFGEVGTKERIKAVLNYKKPAFWIIIIAVIACVVCAVCFLTNPEDTSEPSDSPTDFSEVEEYQMRGEIDKIDYDLDGDGYNEEWTVGQGATSGVYSIVITGKVDGKVKFSEWISIAYCEIIGWETEGFTDWKGNEGLSLKVNMIRPSDANKKEYIYYGVAIDDGKLTFYAPEGIDYRVITPSDTSSDVSIDSTKFGEVEEYQMRGEIDKIDYDLDGDGTDEEWTVGHGPTSGLYSIVVTGKVNGITGYSAMAVIEHGEVSWEILDDKLVIKSKKYTSESEDPAYNYYALYTSYGSVFISPIMIEE